ncbi:universal stress protein [Halococcoides cellulosivorans]|uniref:universal stress protein n=1 Tax=Halococcoides cellulosivorans TaxID=1679096 RepID=UPI001F2DC426|nr:universal stress protein [Halococcoides cellulosivorans]
MTTHVLVALDGSPLAGDALDHALETFDGPITVLNVVTPMDNAMSEGAILDTESDRMAEAEDRANEQVEAACDRTDSADREVETIVETGDPADRILDAVDAHEIDHVVMGSHGQPRGELARRLLGTVSTAVLGEASVPVTVVR